jgi:hypothetical protein
MRAAKSAIVHCCHCLALAFSLCMRWVPLLLVVTLGGCAGPKNTFVVEDPHRLVTSATLRLCGSDTRLVRDGDRLSLTQSVGCEGHGEIELFYADRGPEHCLIGYVTPDAKQDFHFRAEQSSCQSLQ